MNVLGWGIEARPHEWSQKPPAYQMTGNRDVKILSMSTERGGTQSPPASPPYRYRYGHGILLSWLKVGTDGFISVIRFSVQNILAGTNNKFNMSVEYNYTEASF